MAISILELSDGTRTIDFRAANYRILSGGLSLPPPPLQRQFVMSPFADGDRLSNARYANRIIIIKFRLLGTDREDLKTNLRAIERLLSDAQQRTLLGHGAQVYLEYQWETVAGESVYFDVNSGELILPPDFSNPALWVESQIVDVQLVLNCKPFGRGDNQDIAEATLENEQYGGALNFMDIATGEGHGDVPAPMYIKIELAGATGSKKMWIFKRTGARQEDDLFIQGEDEDSTTDIIGSGVTFSDEVDAALSGGKYKRLEFVLDADVAVGDEIGRINFDMATLPIGQFRVLIYCRSNEINDAAYFDKLAWAFGWSYGDKEYAPIRAQGNYYVNAADNTWAIVDLGLLDIPPIAESDIAENSSFQLRIFVVVEEAMLQWVSPTGFVDGSTNWANETNAFDGNTGTRANEEIGASSWGDWVEFTLPSIPSKGMKFYCDNNAGNITQIDIDGYYSAGWNNLYTGVFADATWITKEFGAVHNVTAYRVRLYNNLGSQATAYINEIYFEHSPTFNMDLDFIFLGPADEGIIIIDNIAAADILALDGITDPPNVFKIDGAGAIVDYPNKVGVPFSLGREDTRIYVIRDDVKGTTFALKVKYQPPFLMV